MTPIVFDYDALHDELAKLEGSIESEEIAVESALVGSFTLSPETNAAINAYLASKNITVCHWDSFEIASAAYGWVADSGDCNE